MKSTQPIFTISPAEVALASLIIAKGDSSDESRELHLLWFKQRLPVSPAGALELWYESLDEVKSRTHQNCIPMELRVFEDGSSSIVYAVSRTNSDAADNAAAKARPRFDLN